MATDPNPKATAGAQAQTGATATQSRIPEAIQKKYPNLEELISHTESMSVEEREYWFQIMPIMTDEQIQKLLNILIHEKEQLSKLDKEYEGELAKLNEKHLLEWKEQENRAEREKRQRQEKQEQAKEEAAEAALLQQLNDETPQK